MLLTSDPREIHKGWCVLDDSRYLINVGAIQIDGVSSPQLTRRYTMYLF